MRLAGSTWNRTDSGLYIPPSVGLGDFQYPTQVDYADAISYSIGAIEPGVRDYVGSKEWGVPLLQAVDTISAIYETIAGISVGGKTPPAQAVAVAEGVLGVVGNIYTVTVSAVGAVADVSGAVAGIAGAVPVAGAIIDAAFGLLSWLGDAFDESEKVWEAEKAAYAKWLEKCRRPKHWPIIAKGTGSGGAVTPADLFRDNALAGPGAPMPPSIGSMYIMMCAPEAQGYGPSRDDYNKTWRELPPNMVCWQWPELDQATKRTMWALIKGIMSSVRSPGFHDPQPLHGDGGKTLFPMLNEIVRRKIIDIWGPDKAEEEFLKRARCMANWVVGYESAQATVTDEYGTVGATYADPCYAVTREHNDLAANLVESVRKWQQVLENDVFPSYQGYMAKVLGQNPSIKKVQLSSSAAEKLLGRSSSMGSRMKAMGASKIRATTFKTSSVLAGRKASKTRSTALTIPQKILLASAGLGGSYLAYRGIKAGVRLVRKRRALRGAKRRR